MLNPMAWPQNDAPGSPHTVAFSNYGPASIVWAINCCNRLPLLPTTCYQLFSFDYLLPPTYHLAKSSASSFSFILITILITIILEGCVICLFLSFIFIIITIIYLLLYIRTRSYGDAPQAAFRNLQLFNNSWVNYGGSLIP